MNITITNDSHEAESFKMWLESQGHEVEYGIESKVDGYPCSDSEDGNYTHNQLWDRYCNQ